MNGSGKIRSFFAAIAVAAAALAAITAGKAGAEEAALVNGARVDGAAPGEWTHDWDAAVAGAKESGKPIFVNFTGSDWCGWCKLLKRQVFTQPEWCAWASNHVYLAHIDFPKDQELVPEKYRGRNRKLASSYKVSGYPTCFLLDPNTLEPVGRFGASRDANASDFVKKVSAAMPGAKRDAPAKIRTIQSSTATTNDFKAVLTGVAVVDGAQRNKPEEVTFVPPETKVMVPYGKTALFRVEYDFPKGYQARVWTRDGRCDDGKRHSWYFGSNPSGMFEGKGTAYGFLCLLERGKSCRVRELLLKTGATPELDSSPREWTIATVPIDVDFLEMTDTENNAKPTSAAPADLPRTDGPGLAAPKADGKGASAGLPISTFPRAGLVAGFTFNDEDRADDFVKKGRKFALQRVSSGRPLDLAQLVTNGALRLNGVYSGENANITNLEVPELRYDHFSVAMNFRPDAEKGRTSPLVSFGGGWRWFHVLLRGDGTPVVSFRGLEKGELSFPLPDTVRPGEWNWIAVAFDVEEHRLSVVLNGRRIPDIALPPEFAFRFSRDDRARSRNVQFANTNNGTVFKGEISGFLLFDRAFTDEELDAIAVAPSPPWTFSPDEEGSAFYWNGTVSDGAVTLDAHLADGKAAVSFPFNVSAPDGVLNLRKAVRGPDGTEVPLVGIGAERDEAFVGTAGHRRDATEIRLPATLLYIGPGAFEGFAALARIDCPDSVRRIGSAAFSRCRSLRCFRVGPAVEAFSSDRVFMGCAALEAIEADPANIHYKTADGALFTADGKRLVAFPPGRKGPFAVPAGVEEIPARAFLGCKGLTRVMVPASVKKIGEFAFADCPALERIEFENRAFKLDDRVFGIPRRGEDIHRPATNLGGE